MKANADKPVGMNLLSEWAALSLDAVVARLEDPDAYRPSGPGHARDLQAWDQMSKRSRHV